MKTSHNDTKILLGLFFFFSNILKSAVDFSNNEWKADAHENLGVLLKRSMSVSNVFMNYNKDDYLHKKTRLSVKT